MTLPSGTCTMTFSSISCAAAGGSKCNITVTGGALLDFPAAADASTALVQDLSFTYDGTLPDSKVLIQTNRDLNVRNVAVFGSKALLDVRAGASVALTSVSVTGAGASVILNSTLISLAATTSLLLDGTTISDLSTSSVLINASIGSNTNVTVLNSLVSGINGRISTAVFLYAVQASEVTITGTTFSDMTIDGAASSASLSRMSVIRIVDSATASGSSSSSITSKLSITGSSFTNIALSDHTKTSFSSMITIAGVANFVVTGNTFSGNSASGCAILQLYQSSGTVTSNMISGTRTTGLAEATVCINQDYSAVDPTILSAASTIQLTSNAWRNNTFYEIAAADLLLELMSSKAFPLTAYAISTHKVNVSLSNNQWSTVSTTPEWQTTKQTIPAVFFNQSTVTINEDVLGSQIADINGITEVGSYITLQANVSTTLLGAYGANSFRLSRYILNGFALISHKYSTYAGPYASGAITGGSFEGGILLIETPVFVCCGYIPQPALPILAEFDSLTFTNVNVVVDGSVALVRTTNAVVLTSSTLTVGPAGFLLAPRPISPRLLTGNNPATINGSITVNGVLRAVDLAINGDFTAPTGSSIQVIPTTFRQVAHGLKISGNANIATDTNGNYVSIVSDLEGPALFGSSFDFIGAAYPPSIRLHGDAASIFENPSWENSNLFSEMDTDNLRFQQVGALEVRKRSDINNVSAIAVGLYATQTFDLSGRAIYAKASIPIRGDSNIQFSSDCNNLVSSSDRTLFPGLTCSWVDDYTIMITGNKLPEADCLFLSSPFLIDESCTIDAGNLRAPLASITPVPTPFMDTEELVLDARTSLFLGPDPQATIFVWNVASSDLTIDAALTTLLAATTSPVVHVPISLLPPSGIYNFSVVVSNNFFDSDPAFLAVDRQSECSGYPSVYFDRNVYEVYNNEFSTITTRFDTTCVEDVGFEHLDAALYTWTISAEDSDYIIPDHHEAILTYQFLPILNISDRFDLGGLYFNTPYTLKVAVTRPPYDLPELLASTTIILRYHHEVRVEGYSFTSVSGESPQIEFTLSLEDKIDWIPAGSGSIPKYLPVLTNIRPYVLNCPTDVAAELNMPFGDVKPSLSAMVDLCPYADRSQGWYQVSFNTEFGQPWAKCTISIPASELEYGQYVIGVDYSIASYVSNDAFAISGSARFTTTLDVTEGNKFGTQISALSTANDWAALWYSPSKRVVLHADADGGCTDCIYEWTFPNGELLSAEGPYIVVPAGSLPAGTNTTVVLNAYTPLEFPGQVALRDVFPDTGSSASYNLVMGQQPFGGFFNVTPSSGEATTTKFAFLTQAWESHFPSLSYYYTVVNTAGEWVLGIPSANGTGTNVTIPYWNAQELIVQRRNFILPSSGSLVALRVIDASGSSSSAVYTVDLSEPASSPANDEDKLNDLIGDVSSAALYSNDLNRVVALTNNLAFIATVADPAFLTAHLSNNPARADDYYTRGRQIASALSVALDFIADYPPRTTISPALAHALVLTVSNCAQQVLLQDDVGSALHDSILRTSIALLTNMTYVSFSTHYDDFSASIMDNFFNIANATVAFDANRQVTSVDLLAELGLSIFSSLYAADAEKFSFQSIAFEARQFAYTSSTSTFALSADSSSVTTISTNNNDLTQIGPQGTFRAAVTVADRYALLPSNAQYRRAVTLSLPFTGTTGFRRSDRALAKTFAADYEPVRRTKNLFHRALYSAQSLYYGYDVEGEFIDEQIHLKRAAAYDARRAVLASSIIFSTNFTVPLTLTTSKNKPQCSVYSPNSDNWDPSACTTSTDSNGIVSCTCRASQTQTTLSVLFGSLGGSKGGISKGGIAAAVIFPIIILAVLAVVLVNLFIPALACGPFKRHHNRNKDLNAVQMADVGARAGPPAAASSSSSASARLVSPTPVAASTTYAAPVGLAPEHAPTPDPAPSSGWAKSTPSEIV